MAAGDGCPNSVATRGQTVPRRQAPTRHDGLWYGGSRHRGSCGGVQALASQTGWEQGWALRAAGGREVATARCLGVARLLPTASCRGGPFSTIAKTSGPWARRRDPSSWSRLHEAPNLTEFGGQVRCPQKASGFNRLPHSRTSPSRGDKDKPSVRRSRQPREGGSPLPLPTAATAVERGRGSLSQLLRRGCGRHPLRRRAWCGRGGRRQRLSPASWPRRHRRLADPPVVPRPAAGGPAPEAAAAPHTTSPAVAAAAMRTPRPLPSWCAPRRGSGSAALPHPPVAGYVVCFFPSLVGTVAHRVQLAGRRMVSWVPVLRVTLAPPPAVSFCGTRRHATRGSRRAGPRRKQAPLFGDPSP